MDPFTAMIVMGLINAGASFFNRPKTPETAPRGEYKPPSPEALDALYALQSYINPRGGNMPARNAQSNMASRMFGGAGPSSSGQGGAASQSQLQQILQKMFGNVR